MEKIAIIGFGFCGTMVFGNLIQEVISKKLSSSIKFYIFDRDGFVNAGAGFGDFNDNYILNVPAQKMSAFDDKPNNFLEFVKINYPAEYDKYGNNGYYPRYIYGKYLIHLKEEFINSAKEINIDINLIDAEVLDVKSGFEILASNSILYNVDQVVLATSFAQSKLKLEKEGNDFEPNINLISPIWSNNSKSFHKNTSFNKNDDICIIGTGLSAIDVLVGLDAKNFAGKIYAISRRGNFPKAHFSSLAQEKIDLISANDTSNGIINLLLKIRKFLNNNKCYDLRSVIDSIRFSTKYLWQNLDDKNKKIFLKKLLPYWNIFRHRAPQSSLDKIYKMIEKGNLEIIKSSIDSIKTSDAGFKITLKNNRNIEVKYLVNCLGFDFDIENNQLLKAMLLNKLLEKDLIGAKSLNSKLHLVGGLNIGKYFENTAVPDMRVDCYDVAKNLFNNIVK